MTGDLLINGKDAWENWRINFEDGALFSLMAPYPKKEFVECNSRKTSGRIIRNTNNFDYRELTLAFHVCGDSLEDAFQKFGKFCDEVLKYNTFSVKAKYGIEKRLYYRDCQPISSSTTGIAKFSLKVIDNPLVFEEK